jgi:hypothetical protein
MRALPDWLRRRRVRHVSVATAPADVLLQTVAVLRHFGVRVLRCDVEDGTLEARLATGSRVTMETDGADWHGVARTLESELARGGTP